MQRRDVEMLLVTLVLGPMLAAILLFVVIGLLRFGLPGLATLDLALIVAAWPFAYLLAGPAVLAIGIANAVIAHLVRSDVLRLLLALPVGALIFAVGLDWLQAEGADTPGAVPFTGALVSLLCMALVGAFGTPLRERM